MKPHPTPTSHPLVETLSRIMALRPNFYAEMGDLEDGWLLATEYARQGSAALTEALQYQLTRYPSAGVPDSRTQGSFFIGEYSWFVPGLAIGAYLVEGRVPDLSLDNLAVRYNTYTWHHGTSSGQAKRLEVRFLSGCFATLPDDPAAHHPDAIILPDADALREWLRVKLEAHHATIIECLQTVTRLGRNAQWSLVADNCAALFLDFGKAMKQEKRSQLEGLSFVKVAGSPMKNPRTDYVTLDFEGHCETYRARGGCCRYYMVDENSDKCSTCVLRNPEERDQILLDYMSKMVAQTAAS